MGGERRLHPGSTRPVRSKLDAIPMPALLASVESSGRRDAVAATGTATPCHVDVHKLRLVLRRLVRHRDAASDRPRSTRSGVGRSIVPYKSGSAVARKIGAGEEQCSRGWERRRDLQEAGKRTARWCPCQREPPRRKALAARIDERLDGTVPDIRRNDIRNDGARVATEKEAYRRDLETARRMYRTYPHLFEESRVKRQASGI